jgi:hypothetical protein
LAAGPQAFSENRESWGSRGKHQGLY